MNFIFEGYRLANRNHHPVHAALKVTRSGKVKGDRRMTKNYFFSSPELKFFSSENRADMTSEEHVSLFFKEVLN